MIQYCALIVTWLMVAIGKISVYRIHSGLLLNIVKQC